jgi:Uma2 family endonuclease
MVMTSQRMSIEDFRAFCARPENADKTFELIDGEIIEKTGSFIPSQIASWLITFINMYLMKNPIGYVTGEQGGYRLNDKTLVMPDVAYISKERLPELPEREVPVAPDLAVEVQSPNDSKRSLRQKAERYIASGTSLVWLIFPEEKTAEVYLRQQDVVELGAEGTLEGADILPDLAISLSDIWR